MRLHVIGTATEEEARIIHRKVVATKGVATRKRHDRTKLLAQRKAKRKTKTK